jgi:hypothetical protein
MSSKGKPIARFTEEEKVLFKEMVSVCNQLSQLITMAREQGLEEAFLFFQPFRSKVDQLLNRIKL